MSYRVGPFKFEFIIKFLSILEVVNGIKTKYPYFWNVETIVLPNQCPSGFPSDAPIWAELLAFYHSCGIYCITYLVYGKNWLFFVLKHPQNSLIDFSLEKQTIYDWWKLDLKNSLNFWVPLRDYNLTIGSDSDGQVRSESA